MSTNKEKIDELREKKAKALLGGGEKRIEKQHQQGKLSARERLGLLFDNGFYDEFFIFAEPNKQLCDHPNAKEMHADGVATALGAVDGRLAYAASQDFTVSGGSVGYMHAWKICEMGRKALRDGAPFITINDSGGARIQEGINALRGYGEIFYHNTLLSGVVPQIAIISGPCAGGAAYSPALMDFIIMVKNTGKLFITGPNVIKEVTGEDISAEELGGAMSHAVNSGNIHFVAEDDEDAIAITKKLLSYLPSNNTEEPPYTGSCELEIPNDESLNSILPDDPREAYDMFDVLNKVFDPGSIFEIQADWAKSIIIAFARLNGRVVGVVANQPNYMGGILDINSSDKGARFIRFCNAFNIPILTLVDVPGFMPGIEQEFGGIIRHGAKMLFAYSSATVPKLTLILRKAYGGAFLAMCAKSLGADRVAAWPTAEIAVMGPEGAVAVLNKDEIKNAADPKAKRQELIQEYKDNLLNPYVAASIGMIDSVIEPMQTRLYLSIALETSKSKRELRPQKKHGLIPM